MQFSTYLYCINLCKILIPDNKYDKEDFVISLFSDYIQFQDTAA